MNPPPRPRRIGENIDRPAIGVNHRMMDMSSPLARDLAGRLLAVEAASASASDRDPVHAAVVMIDKLRISLTRFAGSAGFITLLRRTLRLAGRQVPALLGVKIGEDGRLEGFESIVAETGGEAGGDAAVAITSHLLGLLFVFIGEPLTLRLVGEAWPDMLPLDEHSKTETNS